MTIAIRKARPNEAETISDLTMRSKAYWGYSDEFLQACRKELSVLPSDIENHKLHYAVAVSENQIVGYYGLERLSDTKFELSALFVEPGHIGTGIGRTLISHAKNHVLSNAGSTMIIQSDPNACQFYQAAGGVLAGERESGSIPGRYLPMFEIDLANNVY